MHLAMTCEPFSASAVRPGWICCQCRHYNNWQTNEWCWKCYHGRCCISPPEDKQQRPEDWQTQQRNGRMPTQNRDAWEKYLGVGKHYDPHYEYNQNLANAAYGGAKRAGRRGKRE